METLLEKISKHLFPVRITLYGQCEIKDFSILPLLNKIENG